MSKYQWKRLFIFLAVPPIIVLLVLPFGYGAHIDQVVLMEFGLAMGWFARSSA